MGLTVPPAAKEVSMEGSRMEGFVSSFKGASVKKLLKDFISDRIGADNRAVKILFAPDVGEAADTGGFVVIGSTKLTLKDMEVVGRGLIVGVPVDRSMEGSLVADGNWALIGGCESAAFRGESPDLD